MTIAFRDSTVVIIETSRSFIRAGLGLFDLLRAPTVEIKARVGLRRSALPDSASLASTSKRSTLPTYKLPSVAVNDYLVGNQLDEALAQGHDIVVSWPFADGIIHDWTQAEAIWKHVLFHRLGIRRAQNESPVILSLPVGLPRSVYERTCQIFFERFNVAGFGIVERPMAQLYAANVITGVVVDIGYEFTDVTSIHDGLVLHAARATTALGLRDCQRYLAHILSSSQSIVSALSSPAAGDGAGAGAGASTDTSAPPLSQEALRTALEELAQHLWEQGLIRVPSPGESVAVAEDEGVTDIAAILVAGKEKAVIESGMKRKANSKATAAEQARAKEIEALDLVTVEFRGRSVTVGKERHRFCEPLFDPALLGPLAQGDAGGRAQKGDPVQQQQQQQSIQAAVASAIGQADIDQRQYIWRSVFVTGELTAQAKGVNSALETRLAPFILGNPDTQNDVQPRSVHVITVPEYFAEFREKGSGYAGFLGTSIVGKLAFNDALGKNYVSKEDYTEKGPHAIVEMSPSLL